MTTEIEQRAQSDLLALVTARFALSKKVPETFFSAEARKIAEACWAMARRFHQGGRLLAFGNGAWASDAQHIAVEFVHPVIVGKRALPALALTNDSATLSGLMAGGNAATSFARQLRVLARPQDIAIGYSPDGQCANVLSALTTAREMGLLTLGLVGGGGGGGGGEGGGPIQQSQLDFCFVVQSQDPLVIQETHETLYHVLWELVHIYFEHEGLLT
ncbi:phosphoheptose isomerase [Ktedonobacteria bacterium brp13]|nr:phosphoheptose isomerase [Ktedonobacteria bacterium brp13]